MDGKQYPYGKLNANDEGTMQWKIFTGKNRVIIDFGKPVYWCGLTKNEALAIADALKKYANTLNAVN